MGDEFHYLNGSLEVTAGLLPAPETSSDTLIIVNAASALYWRGSIGWAYVAKQDFSANWIAAEYEMISNNASFAAI